MLKKCFGIPSWFPEKEPAKTQRQERINRLFKQLNDLWPDVDILVIAQNWEDFIPIETQNKQIIKRYSKLGILKARQTLREEFLKLDYDYVIMLDDDAIIETADNAHINYMNEIDAHPDGFCFIRGNNHWNGKYNPYKAAQLNLCAISRHIYNKENFLEIDPQKNEGFEDAIYATLLHYKYADNEFICPNNIIYHQDRIPSTWSNSGDFTLLFENTERILQAIKKNKDIPINYQNLLKTATKKVIKKDNRADGQSGAFLYF